MRILRSAWGLLASPHFYPGKIAGIGPPNVSWWTHSRRHPTVKNLTNSGNFRCFTDRQDLNSTRIKRRSFASTLRSVTKRYGRYALESEQAFPHTTKIPHQNRGGRNKPEHLELPQPSQSSGA